MARRVFECVCEGYITAVWLGCDVDVLIRDPASTSAYGCSLEDLQMSCLEFILRFVECFFFFLAQVRVRTRIYSCVRACVRVFCHVFHALTEGSSRVGRTVSMPVASFFMESRDPGWRGPSLACGVPLYCICRWVVLQRISLAILWVSGIR